MALRVEEYKRADGSSPFRRWFDNLSSEAARKVTGIGLKLATGNTSGLKPCRDGVAEWRIDWGGGIRVYVLQDGQALILLLGGSETKQEQNKRIEQAVELAREYKARKKKASEQVLQKSGTVGDAKLIKRKNR